MIHSLWNSYIFGIKKIRCIWLIVRHTYNYDNNGGHPIIIDDDNNGPKKKKKNKKKRKKFNPSIDLNWIYDKKKI